VNHLGRVDVVIHNAGVYTTAVELARLPHLP
jgi:hypothetical protein